MPNLLASEVDCSFADVLILAAVLSLIFFTLARHADDFAMTFRQLLKHAAAILRRIGAIQRVATGDRIDGNGE